MAGGELAGRGALLRQRPHLVHMHLVLWEPEVQTVPDWVLSRG